MQVFKSQPRYGTFLSLFRGHVLLEPGQRHSVQVRLPPPARIRGRATRLTAALGDVQVDESFDIEAGVESEVGLEGR